MNAESEWILFLDAALDIKSDTSCSHYDTSGLLILSCESGPKHSSLAQNPAVAM